jgi:CDP-diacylglycerol--glycerol-3-phosphate 3-phosphatidyltransferase
MARFWTVPEPSIITPTVPTNHAAVNVSGAPGVPRSPGGPGVPDGKVAPGVESRNRPEAPGRPRLDAGEPRPRSTLTGAIGTLCMFPLRAIIRACVSLRIHPNVLTFVGVLINVLAAWALALGRFVTAGVIMLVANIFDFIDGKVAHELHLQSEFGAFWDSTLDRFSDLALLVGLIYLYSSLGRRDYVMVAALALIFSIMTSYARARAESLVEKCKVGFMERPERIVLFMIGAFTNRMAGVLWVILALSVLAVANRIYYTYLALNQLPLPSKEGLAGAFNRAFFWTDERATIPYDLWVAAILAFVWLTPPDWLGDPMATGSGLLGLLTSRF